MWFRDQGRQREARRSDLLRQRDEHQERVKKLAWGWLDGKVSDATLRSMQQEVEKAVALIDRELASLGPVPADPQVEEALAFIEGASWTTSISRAGAGLYSSWQSESMLGVAKWKRA